MVHAAAGGLACQHSPHLLELHCIDDGRGEGGLSNEAHDLGALIHRLPQDVQQRPDHPVRATTVVAQVDQNAAIVPCVQVILHLGCKGLHGKLRVLLAGIVLNIIGVWIQRLGPICLLSSRSGGHGNLGAQLGNLGLSQGVVGHSRDRPGFTILQSELQWLTRFRQPQIYIVVLHVAHLPVLPPQFHRIVSAEHFSEGFHHLIHIPAIQGCDLHAKQSLLLRRRCGEIPSPISPREHHGIGR